MLELADEVRDEGSGDEEMVSVDIAKPGCGELKNQLINKRMALVLQAG